MLVLVLGLNTRLLSSLEEQGMHGDVGALVRDRVRVRVRVRVGVRVRVLGAG